MHILRGVSIPLATALLLCVLRQCGLWSLTDTSTHDWSKELNTRPLGPEPDVQISPVTCPQQSFTLILLLKCVIVWSYQQLLLCQYIYINFMTSNLSPLPAHKQFELFVSMYSTKQIPISRCFSDSLTNIHSKLRLYSHIFNSPGDDLSPEFHYKFLLPKYLLRHITL